MTFPASRQLRRAAVALVGAALVATQLGAPAHAAVAAGNGCSRSAIDVPSCGLLWGLFRPRAKVDGQSQWSAGYEQVENKIGRRLDIVKNYVDWVAGDTFPTRPDEDLAAGGRTLYFSWDPVNYRTRKKISYASIAAGDWDKTVIVPEAKALKAFHGKVFLDFSHEFDAKGQAANGSAIDFAAAYRHIHRVLTNHGVTNVIWSWVSTGWIGNKSAIKAGYPGSKYVDWVGYDPYNLGSCAGRKWNSSLDTLKTFYDWVGAHAHMATKPILLSEYAAADASGVKAWYASLPDTLAQLPRIKALIQFSAPTPTGCDVSLTDSAAAMSGYSQAAKSAYVTGG